MQRLRHAAPQGRRCRPLQAPSSAPPEHCCRRPLPPITSQELERKGEAFNAERRKATDAILDLQRRLAEAESTAQRLTAEHARLQAKLEAQRAAAEVRAGVLVLWGNQARGC